MRLPAIALAVLCATGPGPASGAPVRLTAEAPVRVTSVAPGVVLLDFGKVAFGNLRVTPPPGPAREMRFHLGEALSHGRVDRKPPGSVRYSSVAVKSGGGPQTVAPPPDSGNTRQPAAILTPREWGVLTPFRWVEIEGWPGTPQSADVQRQAAYASSWNDQAASFKSSDPRLDAVWELCRHSVKATTFAGVYVDGDRERIPYEADAYLNQLSHYATDGDPQMARDTFDRLMKHPTWPTEWAFHMIFIAHADWMHTGDRSWLAARYGPLKAKLLQDRARADGLLVSSESAIRHDDIVDWPAGERDGFIFTPVNTVVNAFHLRALALMADLADALGKPAEAADFRAREAKARAAFQEKLYDSANGRYRDGEGIGHASQHASLFPLAFGLVPPDQRGKVAAWVAGRGMACSVYGSQYLLEGLFENGADARALALVTAPGKRSWAHMLDSGATITWEAWDQSFKPNQDWNHAWGAAPANLLPRFVLGVRPLAPGWTRAEISPQPGNLRHAGGRVPTPRGPVTVRWDNHNGFELQAELPAGMAAGVSLPAPAASRGVLSNGKAVPAKRVDGRWLLEQDVRGKVSLEVR